MSSGQVRRSKLFDRGLEALLIGGQIDRLTLSAALAVLHSLFAE
jgi:hypothetical protein